MFAGTEGVRRVMSLSSSSNPGSVAGPLLVPSGLLVVVLLLPALGAAVARWRGERAASRAVAAALLGSAAVTAYLLAARLGWGGVGGAAVELVQPLGRVLAVQRLELAVGLGLDGPAAALLLGLALLGTVAVGGPAGRRAALLGAVAAGGPAGRRAAWLGAGYAATALALMGDTLVLRLAGWELLTVAGWGLSARRGHGSLGLARAADAALLLATALLFWALAGSWSSSRLDARYQLDLSPPAAASEGAGATSPAEPGPSLELRRLHPQLHAASGEAASPVRAALANKLGPGARLLTWLLGLFGLAAALKAGGGALQLLTEPGKQEAGKAQGRLKAPGGQRERADRRDWLEPVAAAAVRLFLLTAPLAAGWDLWRRLR